MTNIIPIEEQIGRNLIVKYADEGIILKWNSEMNIPKGLVVCIILDDQAVKNLLDSMKRRGIIT